MYVSIDVGGTRTRIASSADLTNILDKKKFPTPNDFVDLKRQIDSALEDYLADKDPDFVCIGVPGTVNHTEKKFGKVVNVPYLSGVPAETFLSGRCAKASIFVQNDAALAGLGEATLGAGKNFETVAYITLSTGVGGVRIENKKIGLQKFFEPGHMIIDKSASDPFRLCKNPGCFSSYASTTSFHRKHGKYPYECEDPKIWQEYAKDLAVGLMNVICMWAPDVIVLGGGTSTSLPKFHDGLMKNLFEMCFVEVPPIVHAALGDDAGLMGGFVYISQMLKLGYNRPA